MRQRRNTLLHRILLIARRDYLQTVLSKAYLVGLILLPLFIGGGFLVLAVASRSNAGDQRVAVIDHPGVSAAAVIQACEEASRKPISNAPGGFQGSQTMQRYVFEEVKPDRKSTRLNSSHLGISYAVF